MDKKKLKNIPPVTVFFMAVNIIVYIAFEIIGSTESTSFMLNHGALYGPLVTDYGEYYRLLTAIFLHFGAAHLGNNMLMLYLVGDRLEKAAGHWRFALIYLLGGIGANIFTVFVYNAMHYEAVSAGASGAVMAIIGGLFACAVRGRGSASGMTRRQILILAGFTLYSGFVSSGTNNTAHLSGLIFGFILGFFLYRRRQ